nr:Forkhead box protein like [Ipomoea batatas]
MASSMYNNGISITVSDDESDELAGRIRARVRRKRKKQGVRGKTDFTRRLIQLLLRWWPVLLCLLAVALLLFEASRIGGNSSPQVRNSDHLPRKKSVDTVVEGKPPGNLNRLDPVTRARGGVRERCLDLLPPEELEKLDFPIGDAHNKPVKSIVYKSDANEHSVEGNLTLQQFSDSTRFNLFTGSQSFEQREESFKVSETAVVNCGFYSEAGGFKISDEDKQYMQSCKSVVSTCAFGGGDNLYQPIGMSESSLKKVCYVAFWDNITLATQQAEGRTVGDDNYIGKWRIILVKDLPFSDQRLNGKIPKMLPHRLFPNARYSIWVDSKSQFRRDPLGVFEALLWRSNSVLAISEHGARSSVYDEAKAVVKKNKATPEEVAVQIIQYRKDGLPEDKRFNGKKALSEASIIVREHNPSTNLFMCLWFNEVVRFTSRDQLSFPYVLWRFKVLKNINMFPVCTRKDLVNSIGHVRKAKPLTN